MKVTDDNVERLYEAAKSGHWGEVLAAFADDRQLAGRCSRYAKPSSGWTFLHQAAFFGDEGAVRALIKLGASLTKKSNDGETPVGVAKKKGHVELSKLMETAAESGTHLWEPSPDPELLPSSSAWDEGVVRHAARGMKVAYGGGVVEIRAGGRYFVDSFERVLVGWHGSYNPPCGMDTEPMIRRH